MTDNTTDRGKSMSSKNEAFEETYQHYLSRIREFSLESLSGRLGAAYKDKHLEIPLLNRNYLVSHDEIVDASGNRPYLDICVILSRYILMCPSTAPADSGWANFRDLKDTAPLVGYFAKDVEQAIGRFFSRNADDLKQAGASLGGYPPDLDVRYDISLCFDALPKVPMLLLFNDEDGDFPAKTLVLFDRSADRYLDAECIAMLGGQLFYHLRNCSVRSKKENSS